MKKYAELVKVIDVDIDTNHYFVVMRLKHNPKFVNTVFVYEFVYENDNIYAGLHCIYDTCDEHKRHVIYSDIFSEGDLSYILSDLESQYEYAQMRSHVTDFDIKYMKVIKKYIRKSEVNALKSIAKRSFYIL